MKRNWFFKTVYILAAITVVVNTYFSIKNSLFANINDLPEGKLKYSSQSPSGDKTFNVYLVDNILGTGLRGEIESGGKKKNIFWQTDIEAVETVWENDEILLLNNIPVSAKGDKVYDCRRGTSLFTDGAVAQDLIK